MSASLGSNAYQWSDGFPGTFENRVKPWICNQSVISQSVIWVVWSWGQSNEKVTILSVLHLLMGNVWRSSMREHEGTLDTCVSLYNVIKTNEKFGHAFVVQLDPHFDPRGLRAPHRLDFGYAHDVLCGLGGLASSFRFLSIQTVCAVDWNGLAREAFELSHDAKFIQGNIGLPSAVYQMHCRQHELGVQPLISAGIPVNLCPHRDINGVIWMNAASLCQMF